MVRLITNNQTMQTNTVHLYVIGWPQMDMERHLGKTAQNRWKIWDFKETEKKVGILGP